MLRTHKKPPVSHSRRNQWDRARRHGGDPIPDGLVAIEGNRIAAVGQSSYYRLPDGITIIDAEGGTILPGIINAHVHNAAGAGTRRVSYLLEGVTTICDMGIPQFKMQDFEQERISSGPAARGFKSGPILTAQEGYPGTTFGAGLAYEIHGNEEAEEAVRALQSWGADYIKVVLEPGWGDEALPMMIVRELGTVVETAHAKGLLVRAHVTKSAVLELVLEAGIDVVEHVPMPSNAPEDLAPMFDEAGVFRMPPDLETQLRRMIEQGTVLVPTLETYVTHSSQSDPDPEDDTFVQTVYGVVRFYHDSGGSIALGNDYPYPWAEAGMPLREMMLLQNAGLSPMDVIEAATQHAAYVCGQAGDLGTLEAGKLADLIVVDGNPLDDLNVMGSVQYIVKDGELVFPYQQQDPER